MTALYKAAAELRATDRIPAGFLPGVSGTAEVVYMRRFTRGEDWVFAVYIDPDGLPMSDVFLAEARIPVEPPAKAPAGIEGGPVGSGPGRHTGEA